VGLVIFQAFDLIGLDNLAGRFDYAGLGGRASGMGKYPFTEDGAETGFQTGSA
jgi:hypothetical protein